MIQDWMIITALVALVLLLMPAVVAAFLRDVDAGTIRLGDQPGFGATVDPDALKRYRVQP